MSRPIMEPAPQKQLASHRWELDQLERRPGTPTHPPPSYASVARFIAPFSVPAGGSPIITWEDFRTNDLTEWGTGTSGIDISHNTVGDSFLQPLQQGFVFVQARAQWDAGNYPRAISIGGLNPPNSEIPWVGDEQSAVTNGPVGSPILLESIYTGTSVGVQAGSVDGIRVTAFNFDSSDHDILVAQMWAFYWWSDRGNDTVVYGTGI